MPIDLPTPCALVDLDRVERNAARMARRARELGVRLRPHVKTHKCPAAARIQTRDQFGGITVSTLSEARAFAAAGFGDITLAVPIAPCRIAEALALSRSVRLTLLLDDEAVAHALEAAARRHGVRPGVLIEIDSGHHRTGLDPHDSRLPALASRLARSDALEFRGVLTHAGQAYACRTREEAAAVARHERDTMVDVAQRLRAQGIAVSEVSVGSTPALMAADDLSGVTEVRPGNYLFFDAFQVAIGSCAPEEMAFSVMASVLGCYPDQNRLVLDAGALALSKDPGPTHVQPDCGFGLLATEDGSRLLPELKLEALSQEHGLVRARPGFDVSAFSVGSRLRVYANHSCLAAAQFERFAVVRGTEVVDTWRPVRGW